VRGLHRLDILAFGEPFQHAASELIWSVGVILSKEIL
jgi:hypothetical protein